MSFEVSSQLYAAYLKRAAEKLRTGKDYITALDAATGDGDHWANLMTGFDAILENLDALRELPMFQMYQKIGMLMMSKVGGSSGILYGGAYMAAAKALKGKAVFSSEDLCKSFGYMVQDMMNRGKAEPGFKTMIDALYPAWQAYEKGLAENEDDTAILNAVKQATIDGAEATRGMEAVKGRASYRTDKAVGYLDAGAVTMSWQLSCLCDEVLETLSA